MVTHHFLTGIEEMTLATKSVLLPIAILNNRISLKDAERAARLEAYHQTNYWGNLEDSKYLD